MTQMKDSVDKAIKRDIITIFLMFKKVEESEVMLTRKWNMQKRPKPNLQR